MAALSVATFGVALVMHGLFVPRDPTFGGPTVMQWWVLAVLFASTEVFVIHLPSRRSNHTISLAEIPLVLGLVFAAPHHLLIGRMVGGAAALLFYRRQEPRKAAFNLTIFYLETVGALVVVARLSPDSMLDPVAWPAVMAGVAVSALVGSLLVSAAITLTDPSRTVREVATQLQSGLLVSLVVGIVAIVAAILLSVDGRAIVIVLVVGTMAYAAMGVFGRLFRRHADLLALHGFAAEIASVADSVEDAAGRMLSLVTDRLRISELAMAIDAGGEHPRLWVSRQGIDGARPFRRTALADLIDQVAACDHEEACGCGAGLLGGGRGVGVVVTEGQQPAGVLFVAERASDRGRIERSDRQLLGSMARHFSAVLSGLLANDRLQREVVEKQRVIDSKDELIASVSHEVKTPLTAVLGFSEVLSNGELDGPDEMSEAVDAIKNHAHALNNIVEDLLTAARAELGRLELYATATPILLTVRRAVEHLDAEGGGRIEVEGGEMFAHADPARLRQVVRNLVANARRYGGSTVRVVVRAEDDAVIVAVMDDGEGVPGDAVDRIFLPYESAHPRGSQPGTVGVGLPMSRELARLMGGDLRYRREGIWTVFEVRLQPS